MDSVCFMNDSALDSLRLQNYDKAESLLNEALHIVRKAVSSQKTLRRGRNYNSDNKASVFEIDRPICIGTIAAPMKDDELLEYFNRGFVLSESERFCWDWNYADLLAVSCYLSFNLALTRHHKGIQSASNENDLRRAYDAYRISLSFLEESHLKYDLPARNGMLLVGYMAVCENIAHLHYQFCNRDEALYFHSYFLKAFVDHSKIEEMGPREAEFFSFRAYLASQPTGLAATHSPMA